ncbi:acyltransferase family protein [Mucilaginibacter antarcticus]|uniref:acyltransferase family protein n=1 Tax=Mucilaginibacter antarcticus TaxID=1855725 RepID=UPI00362FA81C
MISLKFGWIGVNIFFVLSGFLITRILVHNKHKSLKNYLAEFFYKRSIRIFPVYYLFIIVTPAVVFLLLFLVPDLSGNTIMQSGTAAIQHNWPYYLTYTYNLKLNLSHLVGITNFEDHFFGHLWSLSVEEQFYLAFPFVVYFASISTLKKVIIGIIILCPLIRLWSALYGVHMVTDKFWLGETLYTNTLCQADALAMGAALAVFPFKIDYPYRNFFAIISVWLLVGLICLFYLRKAGYFGVEGKSLGYNFPGYWLEQVTPTF